MSANPQTIVNDCRALFEGLDSNSQAEVSAQLFLDYCIYQDQCENIRRLAPLVNTVAEALSKNATGENTLQTGVKAVQMYLRIPPVEYFGETISRLGFLEQKEIEEMLKIQPEGKIFGTFLMEQGLITQEQRDISVVAQKRLFTIQEVHERVLTPESKRDDKDVIDSLKGVFQHFLTSTVELEEELKQSNPGNIHDSLQRLNDIIAVTEEQTESVLDIADSYFSMEGEMRDHLEEIKNHTDSANHAVADSIEHISDNLNSWNSLNAELMSSLQIHDRIGQQLGKVVPSIQIFHDQVKKITEKLQLSWNHDKSQEKDSKLEGYGDLESPKRFEQEDVDNLLANLGL